VLTIFFDDVAANGLDGLAAAWREHGGRSNPMVKARLTVTDGAVFLGHDLETVLPVPAAAAVLSAGTLRRAQRLHAARVVVARRGRVHVEAEERQEPQQPNEGRRPALTRAVA